MLLASKVLLGGELKTTKRENLITQAPQTNTGREQVIKKIAVAIDGSDHADHALDFALDLANKFSAKMLLLTAVPPVFLPLPALNVMKSQAIAEASAELENSFREALSRAEQKAKKMAGPNVFTRLEHGNPDEVIIETAKN